MVVYSPARGATYSTMISLNTREAGLSDIPLKCLTALCGVDLLTLLEVPYSTLVQVTSPELQFVRRELDSVMRVRSPLGQEYLHVIEYMGYYDATVLWRLVLYAALLGRDHPHTAIICTLIYLTRAAYVGDTLTQVCRWRGAPKVGYSLYPSVGM